MQRSQTLSFILILFLFLSIYTARCTSKFLSNAYDSSLSNLGNSIRSSILTTAEQIIMHHEKTFWDAIYGGYFESYDVIHHSYSTYKWSSSVVMGIRAYLYLYLETMNESYKQKVFKLIELMEKYFKDNLTGLYWVCLYRDFSTPYVLDGRYDIRGAWSLLWTIKYAQTLVEVGRLLHIPKFINSAIRIFNSIVKYQWDSKNLGIWSYADTWDRLKYPIRTSEFCILAYLLFNVTRNQTYKDFALLSVEALRRMWDNGFHMNYNLDLSVFNPVRGNVHNVIFTPLIAFEIGNILSQSDQYNTYIEQLCDQAIDYFWDSEYGGFYKTLTEDFDVFISDKIVQHQLYAYTIIFVDIPKICRENSKITKIKEKLTAFFEIFSKKIRYNDLFLEYFHRNWIPKNWKTLSLNGFWYAYLLLTGRIIKKEMPSTTEYSPMNILVFTSMLFGISIIILIIIIRKERKSFLSDWLAFYH